VLPFVPAASSLRHIGKFDDLADLNKLYGHIDNFADAGGVIRKAQRSDFSKDGWRLAQNMDITDDGFTISNRLKGTNIHGKFMDGGKTINRYNRVDGIDDTLKIIYELKPYNPRSIRQGIKQLKRYQNAAYTECGEIYRMVLVLY
jgi:hypothetical protein